MFMFLLPLKRLGTVFVLKVFRRTVGYALRHAND